jgi:hypothetical protein
MTYDTYVFNKLIVLGKTRWVIDYTRNGKIVEQTSHASRLKAISSFFARHPNQDQFILSIPKVNKEEKK